MWCGLESHRVSQVTSCRMSKSNSKSDFTRACPRFQARVMPQFQLSCLSCLRYMKQEKKKTKKKEERKNSCGPATTRKCSGRLCIAKRPQVSSVTAIFRRKSCEIDPPGKKPTTQRGLGIGRRLLSKKKVNGEVVECGPTTTRKCMLSVSSIFFRRTLLCRRCCRTRSRSRSRVEDFVEESQWEVVECGPATTRKFMLLCRASSSAALPRAWMLPIMDSGPAAARGRHPASQGSDVTAAAVLDCREQSLSPPIPMIPYFSFFGLPICRVSLGLGLGSEGERGGCRGTQEAVKKE